MIRKEKSDALRHRMNELGIREQDLEEKFVLGGGKGGQKVNKSSTCVQLKHLESGIEVKCQKTRSREDNRFFARRELCDQYEAVVLGKKSAREKEAQKRRKQKKRRARRSSDRQENKGEGNAGDCEV